MTPQELQQRIDALQQELDTLKASTTISFEVDRALRDRFRIDERPTWAVSTKAATTERQSVNEGGSSTYFVSKVMDGFLEVVVNGTLYYIPYFT